MALDFGDAGLFDPIPPAYGNGKGNSNGKKTLDDDEEHEALNGNGWNHDEEAKEPDPDDEDEEDLEEDWASAPPLDILDCIKGYEMVSFDATSVPPPPFEEPEIVEAVDGAAEKTPAGEGGTEDVSS